MSGFPGLWLSLWPFSGSSPACPHLFCTARIKTECCINSRDCKIPSCLQTLQIWNQLPPKLLGCFCSEQHTKHRVISIPTWWTWDRDIDRQLGISLSLKFTDPASTSVHPTYKGIHFHFSSINLVASISFTHIECSSLAYKAVRKRVVSAWNCEYILRYLGTLLQMHILQNKYSYLQCTQGTAEGK